MKDSKPEPIFLDAELQETLIDQLLREELGSDLPPDMTDRIMWQVRAQEAKPPVRRRKRIGPVRTVWRIWWVQPALAAMIAVAVGVWIKTATKESYPAAQVTGAYTVEGGGAVRPGAVVITAPAQEARVILGGYAQVNMAPETRLKVVGGAHFKESVFLEAGEATAQVQKKQGDFAVVTEHLKASVTGTKFTVRVAMDTHAPPGKAIKRTTIRVLEGSVDVFLPNSTLPLHAGESLTYPLPPVVEIATAPPVEPAPVLPPTPKPPAIEPLPDKGEAHVIGMPVEGPDGWSLVERSGRKTLVLSRTDYATSPVKFQANSEYVIVLRDRKFVRAMRVEGEPPR